MPASKHCKMVVGGRGGGVVMEMREWGFRHLPQIRHGVVPLQNSFPHVLPPILDNNRFTRH